MALGQILITNITNPPTNVSLDLKFAPGVQFRPSLAPGASVDVGSIATEEQVNNEPSLLVARSGSSPKVKVSFNKPGSSDLPGLGAGVSRYSISADSTLQASVIGSSVEAIHTALTLTASDLGVARRHILFEARLKVIADNGSDTWTLRVRLGGLTGTVVYASSAINIVAGDVFTVSGALDLRTLGVSGTFDSVAQLVDVTRATSTYQAVVAGAVDTTSAKTLVVTGQCSSGNAGNQVSLVHFDAQVAGG